MAMSSNVVRYIKSTVITFLAGFLPALYISLEGFSSIGDINPALLSGAILAGIRLVLKALIEKIEGRI